MAALTAALITAAVVAASASSYQAVEANQQRQDAKGVANQQKDDAQKLLDEQKKQQQDAENTSTANAMRDIAKQRQQQIIGNAMGRGSTILTGGLGVQTPAQTANHPLLGQ